MLDHHHGVGAARNDPARRDCRCRADHFKRRCNAAGDDLAIEREPLRRAGARPERIRRPQREAVDIGAIERRGVDRGDHVGGNDARQRSGRRQRFAAKRGAIEPRLETPACFRRRNHFEELLLPRRTANGVDDRGGCWSCFRVWAHRGSGKFIVTVYGQRAYGHGFTAIGVRRSRCPRQSLRCPPEGGSNRRCG